MQFFLKNRKRKTWTLLLSILLIIIIGQWTWVTYLFQQAKGGLDVAFNTRPLSVVLSDKNVPDSLKKRILYIGEVRKFAIDSLGLQDNPKVYQTLYDQQGKPLVYLLTVAERYQIKPVLFNFPIIGSFTYKGFFNATRANAEEKSWQIKGYDTDMGQAIAYSTLGWLPEPILSSMLYYSDGKLASLIIHEMTHGTIFVKNNHETSENLANFIGDYGAKRFLKHKYGAQSDTYKRYLNAKIVRDKFIKHLNRGTLQLDSLYQHFSSKFSDSYKDSLKYTLIEKIVSSQDTLYEKRSKVTKTNIRTKELPNNAYFIGFKTYNAKQNEFELMFKMQFHEDFKQFLTFMKTKYNQ